MPLIASSVRWLSAIAFVLCLVGATTQASAQTNDEEQARAHFRLGRAHYDNGDFLRAAQEFEAAFAISQHAQLLYNIYLAYRDANVTRKAAEALKGYLEKVEDVPNRAQLAARLQSLEQALANEPPQPETPPPTTTTEPTTETNAPATTEPTASETVQGDASMTTGDAQAPRPKSKLVPIILMGAGGALIAGGAVSWLMVSGKKSDIEERCGGTSCPADDQEAKDMKSSAQTLALVGDILVFGGVAAAATGVVLFILSGSSESDTPPPATASIACLPGMCGGSVQVSF